MYKKLPRTAHLIHGTSMLLSVPRYNDFARTLSQLPVVSRGAYDRWYVEALYEKSRWPLFLYSASTPQTQTAETEFGVGIVCGHDSETQQYWKI